MPLPTGNLEWPPPSQRPAARLYDRWGAWYSGEPEKLAEVYNDAMGLGGVDLKPEPRPSLFSMIAGFRQRAFWGQPISSGQLRSHKLHIPLAGDIAGTSADLLFGEPVESVMPALADGSKGRTAGGVRTIDPTQERLDEILDESNAHAVWLEAAELSAAYGGVYVRVYWDPAIAEVPLFDALPPDAAVPEFRGGRLVAVTLWRNLERIDGRFWRHLERHERGRVLHGVYTSSSEDKLGRQMALQDHPETAQFAMLVDPGDGQSIETGADDLAIEYVPNKRPHRTLRGSPLGRSDYAGIEPIMDSLDEAWTSWLRDLRLGKGRLIVPRHYVQNHGRGRGGAFDPDREVYEAVDSLDPAGGLDIQIVQFAIRVAEHAETCTQLTAQALRGAGYSTQTFGEAGEVAATATEVVARERRSFTTRAKKIGYFRGPRARLERTALQIDVAKFGTKGVSPDRPILKWPDGVAEDPEMKGRTLQLLAAAEAASIRTRVAMLNPDWSDDEVDEEVIRIREDTAPPAPAVPPPGFTATGQDPGSDRPDGPPGTGGKRLAPGQPEKPQQAGAAT